MKCITETFAEDEEIVMFFEMHLKNAGKPALAYRFTPEQKSFCLALYKQSPKTYRNYLRRYFILPCQRTIGRHSAQLMFESGINGKYFDFLQATVSEMDDIDKHCVLVWDE